MLNMKKSIILDGTSTIDGVVAEGYQAKINSDSPEDMTIAKWQGDKAVYKANRAQCRTDAAEFEDKAYTLQDEIIAAKAEEE